MEQLIIKNGSTITIRKANKLDAEAMLEYLDKISKESDNLTFGNGEFKLTLEQEENFIDNISKQNNAIFLIAEIDGKIIGNLSFAGGSKPRIAHTGEFGVSVLKDYWGQGIGTYLIEYLINWSKESGIIRKVNLRVRSDNYSAIHVYKKLGFIEEGLITRDLFINGNFFDSISMGMKID
ncbi:GNAT family N-acetyltransferase [Tissierella sp. Yu-01]|jgi:RimJ/RimL family protein N-acetyltransferase|uniref:GNAT family N-acetyltransferase n=1 Tax=Tissierella sp. Yu-01 TaxID=3035694 RepID=UPI00240E1BEA|nr:GNAT family N-acetyltransferase [Tissierella sp. Yu-01]WFA08896.1 GNAT family N-acetyltransferase [Tissierella sp. Yu-01]